MECPFDLPMMPYSQDVTLDSSDAKLLTPIMVDTIIVIK